MLNQSQIDAKREELKILQEQNVQQARKIEEQQQLLMRQQNSLVLQIQSVQGQIDALTMVLDGTPEEENHAAREGFQQEDHLPEHSN